MKHINVFWLLTLLTFSFEYANAQVTNMCTTIVELSSDVVLLGDVDWVEIPYNPHYTVWEHYKKYAAPYGYTKCEFIEYNRRMWNLAESGQLYCGVKYVLRVPRESPVPQVHENHDCGCLENVVHRRDNW